jgi:3-deoxy-D-manno-octulosonic-acid transferase
LEAAAFGMPVIFGPKYDKFKEARDLVELKAGFSIGSQEELNTVAGLLMNDETTRDNAAAITKDYVKQHVGATNAIINYIKERH